MNSDNPDNQRMCESGTPVLTAPLVKLTPYSFNLWFQFYLCLTIFANLLMLFWEGSWGDVGFWADWTQQLLSKGYHDFNGNYPPLYIHWLYCVSNIYTLLGLPVENNFFLKYLCLLPVFLSHLVLVVMIYRLTQKFLVSITHFHLCMLLAAVNPAILMNGPVWGQIDILPVIPVVLAIILSTSDKYRLYTFPIYTLALLTKFQMIAFAPVMGIIFFRHYKTHLVGGLLSLLVIGLLFLPFIFAGNFSESFKLAYVDVYHQYGATTMGAANIWILLTGNAAPDSLMLFNLAPDSVWAIFFKAKNFGILCFFLVCLMVFASGIKKLVNHSLAAESLGSISLLMFYSMICTAAFFILLPAMHERYLLPAVILSLFVFVVNPCRIVFPLIFSFVSAFNIAMCIGIKTNHVWPVISWVTLGVFGYAILELVLGSAWTQWAKKVFLQLFSFRYIAVVLVSFSLLLTGVKLYKETKIHFPELTPGKVLLTDFPLISSTQDYEKLHFHKNISGSLLQVGNRRYAYGLGTHANSRIDFYLDGKAKSLSIGMGLDDQIESASVKFLIWGDGHLLWESKPYYGAESVEFIDVNLEGVKYLRLEVNSMEGIDGDHADWVNPVIRLR